MAVVKSFDPATTLEKTDNYIPILDDLPACGEYDPGNYLALRSTSQDEANLYWINSSGCPEPLLQGEVINNEIVLVGGLRPLIAILSEPGTDLAVATSAIGGVILAQEGEILSAGIGVDVAPVGANILVDVNKNGTSIFGAQKLQIDAGETKSQTASNTAVISTSAVSEFDVLTFDIDQVGSSTAGQNLSIFLKIKQKPTP